MCPVGVSCHRERRNNETRTHSLSSSRILSPLRVSVDVERSPSPGQDVLHRTPVDEDRSGWMRPSNPILLIRVRFMEQMCLRDTSTEPVPSC